MRFVYHLLYIDQLPKAENEAFNVNLQKGRIYFEN